MILGDRSKRVEWCSQQRLPQIPVLQQHRG